MALAYFPFFQEKIFVLIQEHIYVKFIYSEKATKFCKISTVSYIGQIYSGDFAKICGLLRIYELYKRGQNSKWHQNRVKSFLKRHFHFCRLIFVIYVHFFHTSHKLTSYCLVIVHKFTRIYPVCTTYELTELFM